MNKTRAVAGTGISLRLFESRAPTELRPAQRIMIAAHASACQQDAKKRHEKVVLVTRDRVFSRVPKSAGLVTDDWTVSA